MNADPNPDRLRQVLRLGDPAAPEPGLTADEAHAMRRAVLTAIPEPRRRFAWLPLAAGTAALLVLALAVALGPWRRPPASPAQVAAVPTPAAAPSVPSTTTARGPVELSRPERRRPVRAPKALPVRPIRQDEPPRLAASPPVREIQFSTPGGTRVIWELSTKDAR
jgi:hypothetical protein